MPTLEPGRTGAEIPLSPLFWKGEASVPRMIAGVESQPSAFCPLANNLWDHSAKPIHPVGDAAICPNSRDVRSSEAARSAPAKMGDTNTSEAPKSRMFRRPWATLASSP